MKLFNHIFETIPILENFISHLDTQNRTIFIQVLCGDFESNELQNILNSLKAKLPNASIIGASTAGGIVNGKISRNSIVISFSLFDAVDVQTYYFPKSDFQNGVSAASKVLKENTKACIIFSEALRGDAEYFLEGFSSINDKIVVAGGNAGDDFQFKKTFVIESNIIHEEGVVVATLNSDSLHVNNQYSLEWTPIGSKMTVTKCDKNVIYEINNKPVEEIFAHYLGKESISTLPKSAIEFPLVKLKEDIVVARSMIDCKDGGFVFAGHFIEGDQVKFALGNVDEVLKNASVIQSHIANHPAEATYIYSCSVRDLFLKDQLNYEFGLIDGVAPTAGFFAYGEFFHSATKNQLLNITTTTLTLSESQKIRKHKEASLFEPKQIKLNSLIHLVNTTQRELDVSMFSLNQYKNALEESAIVSKTDTKGIITYVNDAFCEVSGYERSELIGQPQNIMRHPDMPRSVFKELWKTIKSGKIWKGTLKNLKKGGGEYYLKTVIVPVFDSNKKLQEYISVRTDVSEIVMKDNIIKKSLLDSLTAIKNRTSFFNALEEDNTYGSLLLINIDRFSEINSYFGYDTGDEVLKQFASQLKIITESENIFRIAGDEFAILYSNFYDGKNIKSNVLNMVKEVEAKKMKIFDNDIFLDITCALSTGHPLEIYKQAHIALKNARENGKKIVYFNEDINLEKKIYDNIETIAMIKTAIKDDRIIPFFQGILDNKTKKITKYESLIRLKKSDGSILSPFFFLEHAKKAKIYDELTHIMIQKSFEMFANLDYEFSINFTITDILSPKTRGILRDNLKEYGCGDRLVLEIVESEGIDKFEEIVSFIEEIKSYGCKIAIDDFGSGYSNFSYLTKLKVDYVKIDGSLIQNIDTDKERRAIVQSILFFTKSQGIKTIAEFVETQEVFNVLVELGVDFSQGYLFSKPAATLVPTQ